MKTEKVFQFDPGPFGGLANDALTKELWSFLNEHETIIRMDTATFLRRPALEAVQPQLIERFGEKIQPDRCKQMMGRMARQVMEHHGYLLDQTNVRIRSNILFSSAARYKMG